MRCELTTQEPIIIAQNQDGLGRIAGAWAYALRLLVCVQLTCLMLLTAIDVIMRYAMSAPIRGSFEITELMLALLMFSGIPLASLNNQHVSVGILDGCFTRTTGRIVDILSNLVCFVFFAGIALLLLRQASRMTMTSNLTIALRIPIVPFVYVMFSLVVLTALIHGLRFIKMLSHDPRSESQV